MSDIAISVRKVTKKYEVYGQPIDRLKEAFHPFKKKYHKDFHALSEVSFEIGRGECVGIIGRNGAGKSTILKVITGVLSPTSGEVEVKGKISSILELGTGFNMELSGRENVYYNAMISGVEHEIMDSRIQQIIDFAELGDFIEQPIKTYSSGMKARLAFAAAINVDPDILIVDEALSVGDAAFGRKCFAKMEEIRANGATILFVSHSEGSIVALCNRAIWLNNGSKVLDGDPKLVTGLYTKYSNETSVKISEMHQEYKELEQKQAELAVLEAEGDSEEVVEEELIKAYYDPELTPSTIVYAENGARISNVRIETLAGEKVNVLVHGEPYIYKYDLECESFLYKAQFGCLIKEKNGVPISGYAYPSKNDYLEDPISGTKEVCFHFNCHLANGQYFFNAGVIAQLNDDKLDYAHRILDAYMIRVIEAGEELTASVKLLEYVNN